MANRELAGYTLISPDFLTRSFWVLRKLLISFSEILVDGILRRFQRGEIAVVNDRSGHTAEY